MFNELSATILPRRVDYMLLLDSCIVFTINGAYKRPKERH